jgi:hypothetical protein
VEAGGHNGEFRLTHWADMDYTVTTSRRLAGLRNGTYTLAVWVRSDGDQTAAYVGLRDCGGSERRTERPRPAAGGLRPHLRRAAIVVAAGHPGPHRADRQRDQRRHAVAGRPVGQLGRPRRPALTTIRHPLSRISTEMVRLLLDLIDGQPPAAVILPTSLVIRDSA